MTDNVGSRTDASFGQIESSGHGLPGPQRRLEFLAEATTLLAGSLDYQATLANVARLAVPELADWCAVDTVDESGVIRRVALVHLEPSKEALIRELWTRYPRSASQDHPVAAVLRSGQTDFVAEISDSLRASFARDDQHLKAIQSLDTRARISVPLVARGRTLGAITFALEGERRYGKGDVTLAEEVATTAALAVDNARLRQEARDGFARREALVNLARLLGAETEPDRMLTCLLDHGLALLYAEGGEVFRWDSRNEALTSAAINAGPASFCLESGALDLRHVVAEAIARRVPISADHRVGAGSAAL